MKNGCTVSICALDLSKAFDKVDHFGLLQLLMKRHLPKNLIGTLLDWFSFADSFAMAKFLALKAT